MSEGGISFNKTPGGGGGGPGGEKPEFELFRSEVPTASPGPPPALIALIVVGALAGGGWLLFGRNTAEEGGTDSKTGAVATVTVEDVEAPSAVLDLIDLKASEDLESGLAFAEEKLETYPCQEIRDRIARYRKELGLGLSADQLIKESQKLAEQKQWDEAIAKVDKALESEEDNKQSENAHAYYLRGACKGFSGDRSGGVEDLKMAIELGYEDKAAANRLIKKWSN